MSFFSFSQFIYPYIALNKYINHIAKNAIPSLEPEKYCCSHITVESVLITIHNIHCSIYALTIKIIATTDTTPVNESATKPIC